MSESTPAQAAEIQAIRDAYAALNRNDIPAFTKIFDPQIERIEFLELPQGGTYHGLAAVTEHIVKGRGSWAEGTCEPTRFIASGDKVIVFAHVHVRLKHETDWREGDTADVFTFRNGKVIQFRTFLDKQQALDWAGANSTQM